MNYIAASCEEFNPWAIKTPGGANAHQVNNSL